ncbi:MAG TPA: T9SS type A sorting domain-containing protein [Bacteroidota bacterium]|nr:T9SS type A sorting domain-containing protein [Bacteroidota bacterium]
MRSPAKMFSTPPRLFLILLPFFFALTLHAQDPKYRTFSQDSLAEKKAKAGKLTGSNVCFKFTNTTDSVVNALHAKLNTHIVAITGLGGFTTGATSEKDKSFDVSGTDIQPGDSVTICLRVDKKDADSHTNAWWWLHNGNQVGAKNGNMDNISYDPIYTQPNGGNVLEYIYKKIVNRPDGIVIGIPQASKDSAKLRGWIRYLKADRKYFPHTGEPRCFDLIANGSGGTKPFVKQLKNPHVKKHDNHLLGEVHALKLACVANQSGFTEPLDSNAALFSDLVYNDSVNTGDPCNGKSIRDIIYATDSALTYCNNFDSVTYAELDYCISRINAAFDGPYIAASFSPYVIAGTHTLGEVYFLHTPPANVPFIRPKLSSINDLQPDRFELRQNYPNPFNPTTTIEFSLSEPSRVTLTVYSLLGQQVGLILNNEDMEDGEQSVEFDAASLPSGIYFYRIVALRSEDNQPVYNAMKKMVLVK